MRLAKSKENYSLFKAFRPISIRLGSSRSNPSEQSLSMTKTMSRLRAFS
jgi:hypothetical protein